MRRRLLAVARALAFVGGGPAADATEPEALPSSIAAIGDSITQAMDACCWYGNHPANSWSTGGSGSGQHPVPTADPSPGRQCHAAVAGVLQWEVRPAVRDVLSPAEYQGTV